MTPILAQVRGDADCASSLSGKCRFHGIGFDIDRGGVAGVASLSQGGDMVDIDAEQR